MLPVGQVSEATGVRGWDPQRRTVPWRIRDPLRSASFDPAQEKLPRDGHWFTHDWGCPVSGSVQGVGGHCAHDASFPVTPVPSEDCTLLRHPRPAPPSLSPRPRLLLPVPMPWCGLLAAGCLGTCCVFGSDTSW